VRQNFTSSLAVTLKYEGGFSNHPQDPGGATMKGVTQRVYDAWRRKHGLQPRSVRQLGQDELEAIYRRDYWDRCRCDDLPSGVDLAVFDFAVNSGPVRAIKTLQAVIGVAADGVVGPRTLAASKRAGTGEAVCAARLAFVRRLRTFPTFGKGWTSRINDITKKVRALAKAQPHVEEKTIFDEVLDTIDWTRNPEEAARQVPPPSTHRDDALHVYLVPAIIAFIGALASADWNTAFDNPQASILVILTGAAAAAYQAAAPWYLKMIWKGPVSA
jgi:lysozyme family protein